VGSQYGRSRRHRAAFQAAPVELQMPMRYLSCAARDYASSPAGPPGRRGFCQVEERSRSRAASISCGRVAGHIMRRSAGHPLQTCCTWVTRSGCAPSSGHRPIGRAHGHKTGCKAVRRRASPKSRVSWVTQGSQRPSGLRLSVRASAGHQEIRGYRSSGAPSLARNSARLMGGRFRRSRRLEYVS